MWLVGLVGWLVGLVGWLVVQGIAMYHLSSSPPPNENLDLFFLENMPFSVFRALGCREKGLPVR